MEHLEILKKYKRADIRTVNKHHLEIERLLHLIIEIAGDINYHLIVLKSQTPPKDLRTSFIQMGERGVIPKSLAELLAPSAGLRNALIHMYDDINITVIQKSIRMTLIYFQKYVKYVEIFLTRSEQN